MTRYLSRRKPQRNVGFSWGRVPAAGGAAITWRLFRRDYSGACHLISLTFKAETPRDEIAGRLLRARHKLRDKVDEIDLAAMGVTE
ncbi:hypothetical protein [Xanthomonas translucens]|uniref:Uncharacterized protein n=2 Tax=Xanthomonas campestris pv. translucens TaxID=343 RepID=A0A109HRS2_XANCT|nr:hypothetical protein [Xanthomonas translucens]KWV17178.1 hypothetical protein ATB53_00425 [Xanthomonas translucens]QSQ34662.1 hypothetical protein ISN31_03285 [Xanthomonas translucens pv. translucens]